MTGNDTFGADRDVQVEWQRNARKKQRNKKVRIAKQAEVDAKLEADRQDSQQPEYQFDGLSRKAAHWYKMQGLYDPRPAFEGDMLYIYPCEESEDAEKSTKSGSRARQRHRAAKEKKRAARDAAAHPETIKLRCQAPSLAQAGKDFDQYNETWDSLSSSDTTLPFPSHTQSLSGLQDRTELHPFHQEHLIASWSVDLVGKTNAKIFFLRGSSIEIRIEEQGGKVSVVFEGEEDERGSLAHHLKRQEMLRWHPDKINLRTGEEGVVDERIGKREEVVNVRSAIQELICDLEQ